MAPPRRPGTRSATLTALPKNLPTNSDSKMVTVEGYGLRVGQPVNVTEVRKADSFVSPFSTWVARAEWYEDSKWFGGGNSPCCVITFKNKQGVETVSCLYLNFTRYTWRLFLGAGSKGKWVHRNIVNKNWPYRLVGRTFQT